MSAKDPFAKKDSTVPVASSAQAIASLSADSQELDETGKPYAQLQAQVERLNADIKKIIMQELEHIAPLTIRSGEANIQKSIRLKLDLLQQCGSVIAQLKYPNHPSDEDYDLNVTSTLRGFRERFNKVMEVAATLYNSRQDVSTAMVDEPVYSDIEEISTASRDLTSQASIERKSVDEGSKAFLENLKTQIKKVVEIELGYFEALHMALQKSIPTLMSLRLLGAGSVSTEEVILSQLALLQACERGINLWSNGQEPSDEALVLGFKEVQTALINAIKLTKEQNEGVVTQHQNVAHFLQRTGVGTARVDKDVTGDEKISAGLVQRVEKEWRKVAKPAEGILQFLTNQKEKIDKGILRLESNNPSTSELFRRTSVGQFELRQSGVAASGSGSQASAVASRSEGQSTVSASITNAGTQTVAAASPAGDARSDHDMKVLDEQARKDLEILGTHYQALTRMLPAFIQDEATRASSSAVIGYGMPVSELPERVLRWIGGGSSAGTDVNSTSSLVSGFNSASSSAMSLSSSPSLSPSALSYLPSGGPRSVPTAALAAVVAGARLSGSAAATSSPAPSPEGSSSEGSTASAFITKKQKL